MAEKVNTSRIKKALEMLRKLGIGHGMPGDPTEEFYVANKAFAELENLRFDLNRAITDCNAARNAVLGLIHSIPTDLQVPRIECVSDMEQLTESVNRLTKHYYDHPPRQPTFVLKVDTAEELLQKIHDLGYVVSAHYESGDSVLRPLRVHWMLRKNEGSTARQFYEEADTDGEALSRIYTRIVNHIEVRRCP